MEEKTTIQDKRQYVISLINNIKEEGCFDFLIGFLEQEIETSK